MEAAHLVPHFDDLAGHLEARNGQCSRGAERAAVQQDLGVVDAGVRDPDQDLVSSRRRNWKIHELKYCGSADTIETDSAH
jgi:hypothetical protein